MPFCFAWKNQKDLSISNRNKGIKTKLTRNFIGNSQHIMVEKSLWKEHKGVKEILAILHFLTYMYFYWKITLWSEIKEDKTQNKSLLFPGFGGQEDFSQTWGGGAGVSMQFHYELMRTGIFQVDELRPFWYQGSISICCWVSC